jgi:L-seryl-tRNA(Ser) seleniumtransferase
MSELEQSLSQLPSMSLLLREAAQFDGLKNLPRQLISDGLREALAAVRAMLTQGKETGRFDSRGILEEARRIISEKQSRRLVRVINTTGIVLHTGLGRSVLSAAAVKRLTLAASGYCNLEIDLDTGSRGRRGAYAEHLLCRLSGAEAAMIVNNNAAATMLVLHGLARGREVIVSRGQLIEIGGSFRLPEVMSAGGAVLREVGTTNKTHLRDYEIAIGPSTAMIMHVHTSNYRVVGFAQCPSPADLAELAHSRKLPLFDDLGSGALLGDELWSEAGEPTVVASLRAGADVVAFSGDKLLGGPQCGVLLGISEVIEKLRTDPMARALRVDKLTIAALEATLEEYQDNDKAQREIPTLAALHEDIESLIARAETLAQELRNALPGEAFHVHREQSFAGGGSMPDHAMNSAVIRWRPAAGISLDGIAHSLRHGTPAVLVRIHEDHILFDLRTIPHAEYDALTTALVAAARMP